MKTRPGTFVTHLVICSIYYFRDTGGLGLSTKAFFPTLHQIPFTPVSENLLISGCENDFAPLPLPIPTFLQVTAEMFNYFLLENSHSLYHALASPMEFLPRGQRVLW